MTQEPRPVPPATNPAAPPAGDPHAHDRQDDDGGPARTAPPPASPGVIYTCPMHPEIRQRGPGHCPICGMALEPEMPTAAGGNPELADMTRRFWVATALTVPVAALEMAQHLGGLAMQVLWITISAVLVSLAWRLAVRRFSAVGG